MLTLWKSESGFAKSALFARGLICCVAMLFSGCGRHSEISAVKGGVLKAIPTTTLEKYFDGVYKSSDWSYQQSAIGEKIVIAKGYVRNSVFAFATLDELRRATGDDVSLQNKLKMYLVAQKVAVSDSVRQACSSLAGVAYPDCLSELDRRYSAEAVSQYLGDDLAIALVKFKESEPRANGLPEDAFVDMVKPLLKRLQSVDAVLKAPLSALDYKELNLTSCKELAEASPDVPVSGKISAAIRNGGERLSLVPYECVPDVYRYEEWRFVIDPGKENTFHFASFKPYLKADAISADEASDEFWSILRRQHEQMLTVNEPVSKKRAALKELN